MGIPGLILLQRFSPLGVRDPIIVVEEAPAGPPLSRAGVLVRGVAGGIAGLAGGAVCVALLAALKATRGEGAVPFDFGASLRALLAPAEIGGWLELLGLVIFGAVVGLATAAIFVARRSAAGREAAASA